MNLTAIIQSVQDRGYGTDISSAITDMINDKYREVWGERRWWWREKRDTSISTIIGTATYSLAGITDLDQPSAARLQLPVAAYPGGVYSLKYMPPQEIEDNIHLYRDVGVPEYWSFANGTLQIWPYPDQIYTVVLDYSSIPAVLVAGGDTPIFPVEHHTVLVWGTISDLCFRDRDVFNGRTADGKWEEIMSKMRRAENVRQQQSSRYVGRSGIYDTFYKFTP